MGKGRWASGETLPEAPVPLFCLPAPHPHPDAQRERVVRADKWGTEREAGRDSPVGRAGHPRAKRSSSQAPAMAHLVGGRSQLQT